MAQPPVGAAPQRRWYREPFVWLCITPPLAAVVAGIVTTIIAVQGFDGVVIDDYYKKGLAINRVIERDQRAAAMGLSARFDYDHTVRTLTVHIESPDPESLPATLVARLLHATRGGLDHQITLERTPAGTWFAPVPPLARGHYHVQVEEADWRLTGDIYE
ncbi:MAG TPA: hypothetical protein DCY89_03850 [Gammaproteobacteria bacterium]|nr:hypothetical protein [Gammaproteobacteria bacterium]